MDGRPRTGRDRRERVRGMDGLDDHEQQSGRDGGDASRADQSRGSDLHGVLRSCVMSESVVGTGSEPGSESRERRFRLGLVDRDQRHADVAQLLEQAMEGRLIGHQSDDDGRAVTLVSQGHPAEPIGPAAVEVSLQADLVLRRLMAAVSRSAALVHLAPSSVHLPAMSVSPTAGSPRWTGRWGRRLPNRGESDGDSQWSPARREEAEFITAPNGGPAVVHAELRVDALRVGTHRAQPHDQLVGDTGAIKVRGEQPQDIKLPLAERLREALTID